MRTAIADLLLDPLAELVVGAVWLAHLGRREAR
jgi:hypothetical protein